MGQGKQLEKGTRAGLVLPDRRRVLTHGALIASSIAFARGRGRVPWTGNPGPSISTVTPTVGGESTPVTITGTGFHTQPSRLLVGVLGGTTMNVTSAAANQINAKVNAVAAVGSGLVVVVNGQGSATNDFTYDQFGNGSVVSVSRNICGFVGSRQDVGPNFSLINPTPGSAVGGGLGLSGELVLDTGPLGWGNSSGAEVDVCVEDGSQWMCTSYLVDFLTAGISTPDQCMLHIRAHCQHAADAFGYPWQVTVGGSAISVVRLPGGVWARFCAYIKVV